jgi:hypothetical protein
MPLERVEAELCTLAGQIAAATCRFLVLLADFDVREGWGSWNVRSCAQWLSWRCGLDLRTAREHVRVARALAELPRTREAFEAGRISYSKARAVVRVATPETEADLVTAALHAPAAHVERLTRGLATAERNAENERPAAGDAGRDDDRWHLRWRWDDDGSLVVWSRMAPDDGARFLAGLQRADAERDRRNGSAEPDDASGPAEPGRPQRRPDVTGGPPKDRVGALVAMAEMVCAAVEAPVHAPVADVLVHVDAATLVSQPAPGSRGTGSPTDAEHADTLPRDASGTGSAPQGARTEDGPALAAACAQRLACDGRVALAVHGSDGRTLDVGRWRRRPTAAQRTALWLRDRGCAVPGCGRTRFLHAHHVTPWARGGTTSMDNMILLCGEHHRALHEGAFSIVAFGRQRFRFHGPGGATYAQAPRTHGSAVRLVAEHPDVRPDTIEPRWAGEPLDLDWAVLTYLQSWALERSRDQSAAPQPQFRPDAWSGGDPPG